MDLLREMLYQICIPSNRVTDDLEAWLSESSSVRGQEDKLKEETLDVTVMI